ncbi:MAG TPA: class I SAM-dependent methyltransferase [Acidimicrobiales bacterium]|nr:class I SAM-dependent methyltransferase [Acidimicrobiales bacterium]
MKTIRRLETAFWSANSRVWDDGLADDAIAGHIDDIAAWLAAACPAAATVVDLGCGTGNHTAALRARGLRVVGADIAPGMLARAQHKTDARGRPPALVRTDLQQGLPFADASVDAALSVFSTQFLDLRAFLAEVWRTLRSDGVVLLEVPAAWADRGRCLPTRRSRAFTRVKQVAAFAGQLTGSVHLRSPEAVRSILTVAGFTVVDERTSPNSYAVLARA